MFMTSTLGHQDEVKYGTLYLVEGDKQQDRPNCETNMECNNA